jgi:hypothetical protein
MGQMKMNVGIVDKKNNEALGFDLYELEHLKI